MNDKQFYIIALQLVEVLCARGAIKGEELDVISQVRKYITDKLKEMEEPVVESVDELKEDKLVDSEEK
jgi:hypothetical protein|tara:strand:- start:191 stop:394 length:204 start_codon:yes stop_codon:yes gene_type:complete